MSKSQSLQSQKANHLSNKKIQDNMTYISSDCFIKVISEGSIKELKKLLKMAQGNDTPLFFERNLFHHCLEEGNSEAFKLLTKHGFNYLQQFVLDDVLKFECLEILPLYLNQKEKIKALNLTFSPNWPNETLIHVLLDNGILQEEICAKFSLKEEFLLFDSILIAWEKKKFESTLSFNIQTQQDNKEIDNIKKI